MSPEGESHLDEPPKKAVFFKRKKKEPVAEDAAQTAEEAQRAEEARRAEEKREREEEEELRALEEAVRGRGDEQGTEEQGMKSEEQGGEERGDQGGGKGSLSSEGEEKDGEYDVSRSARSYMDPDDEDPEEGHTDGPVLGGTSRYSRKTLHYLAGFDATPPEKQDELRGKLREHKLDGLILERAVKYDEMSDTFYVLSDHSDEVLFRLFGEAEVQSMLGQMSPEKKPKGAEFQDVTSIDQVTFHVKALEHLGRIFDSIDLSRCDMGSTAHIYCLTDAQGRTLAYKVYKDEEVLSTPQLSCYKRERTAARLHPESLGCVPYEKWIEKSSHLGIRYRDSQGVVQTLDAERTAEIIKIDQPGGTAERRVMVMHWVEGEDFNVIKRTTQRICASPETFDDESLIEEMNKHKVMFTAEEWEKIEGLLKPRTGKAIDKLHEIGKIYTLAVLRVLAQGTERVHDLHSAGLYHIDLKPESFKITPKGEVVLLDLGASLNRNSQEPDYFFISDIYSDVDSFVFMEYDEEEMAYLIDPRRYKPSDDVYLLAATGYALLTGKTRPSGSEYTHPAADFNPHVNELLDAILAKGLIPSNGQPIQEERFQTADEYQFTMECYAGLQQGENALEDIIRKTLARPARADEMAHRERLSERDRKLSAADIRDEMDPLQEQLLENPRSAQSLRLIERLYQLLLILRRNKRKREEGDGTESGLGWLDVEETAPSAAEGGGFSDDDINAGLGLDEYFGSAPPPATAPPSAAPQDQLPVATTASAAPQPPPQPPKEGTAPEGAISGMEKAKAEAAELYAKFTEMRKALVDWVMGLKKKERVVLLSLSAFASISLVLFFVAIVVGPEKPVATANGTQDPVVPPGGKKPENNGLERPLDLPPEYDDSRPPELSDEELKREKLQALSPEGEAIVKYARSEKTAAEVKEAIKSCTLLLGQHDTAAENLAAWVEIDERAKKVEAVVNKIIAAKPIPSDEAIKVELAGMTITGKNLAETKKGIADCKGSEHPDAQKYLEGWQKLHNYLQGIVDRVTALAQKARKINGE